MCAAIQPVSFGNCEKFTRKITKYKDNNIKHKLTEISNQWNVVGRIITCHEPNHEKIMGFKEYKRERIDFKSYFDHVLKQYRTSISYFNKKRNLPENEPRKIRFSIPFNPKRIRIPRIKDVEEIKKLYKQPN